MEKTTTFLIIAGSFVLALIMGPIHQLYTGKIEFKKLYYPNAEPIFRSRNPQKFYLRIAFDIFFLFVIVLVVYWVMFEIKTK